MKFAAAIVLMAFAAVAMSKTVTVTMTATAFDPVQVVAAPGDTVQFVNSAGSHRIVPVPTEAHWVACNISSTANALNLPASGTISESGTFSWTIAENAAVNSGVLFVCEFHCSVQMRGLLTIEADEPASTTTGTGQETTGSNQQTSTGNNEQSTTTGSNQESTTGINQESTTGQTSGTVIEGTPDCVRIGRPDACVRASGHGAGVGDYCGWCQHQNEEEWTYYSCGSGSYCSSSGGSLTRCVEFNINFERLGRGDACNPELDSCGGDNYDLECVRNSNEQWVCGGEDVFAPGEDCPTHNDLAANPCIDTACTNGVCQFAETGASCTGDLPCKTADYCTADGVCAARIAIGQTCNNNLEGDEWMQGCVRNAQCLSGTCVEVLSRGAGENCGSGSERSDMVCGQNMKCGNDYTCVLLDREGAECNVNNDDSCGEYYDCECNYQTGTGVCIADLSEENRIANQLRQVSECLIDHNCNYDTEAYYYGCLNDCAGTLRQAAEASFEAEQNLLALQSDPSQTGNGAAALMIAAVAVIVAVALAL